MIWRYVLIGMPISGAGLVYLGDRSSKKLRNAISFIITAATLALNSLLLYGALGGESTRDLASGLVADPPGLIMSEFILLVGLLSMLFSSRYMEKEIGQTGGGSYYALFLAFVGTLIGLSFSTNLLYMLLFLETSTAISAVLILYGGRTKSVVRATVVYLIISLVESVFVLFGIFSLAPKVGWTATELASTNVNALCGSLGAVAREARMASALLLMGFGTKAGLVPLGIIWLPLAHSEAPSPVSSMLSGVMIKSAFVAMFRCAHALSTFTSGVVSPLMTLTGFSSMWLGIIGALISKDVKRVLGFHSVCQMGYIALGAAPFMSQPQSDLSVVGAQGAFYHAMNHAVFKSCLFLATGVFWYHLRTRNWEEARGVGPKMPITMGLWFLAAWSMAGVFPPLNGYYSKHMIEEASGLLTLDPAPWLRIEVPALNLYLYGINGVSAFVVSLLTFYCLTHVGLTMSTGTSGYVEKAKEGLVSMLIPMTVLGVLCVAMGTPGTHFLESKILERLTDYFQALGG